VSGSESESEWCYESGSDFGCESGSELEFDYVPSRDPCRGRSRSASGGTSLDPILGGSRCPNWSRIMFPSRDPCRGRSRSPIGGTSLDLIHGAIRDPNWSRIVSKS
jgi:hypothetical protein